MNLTKLNSPSIPPSCFKILNLGDLHFGNRYLGTESFINKIEKFIVPHLQSGIDILFIPGDFVDRLFTMNHHISRLLSRVMTRFISLAIEHKFLIRVVRGTYTHDHDQNEHWIENTLKLTDDPNIVKVFNSVAYEEVLGLHVVYIPDSVPKNTVTTIRKMMKDRSIDKLDFIVGHGYLEHVLPPGKPIHETVFNVDVLSKLSNCIVFGHIHTFSIYKNSLYTGSFDRFRHGEEEDKGFVIIYYSQSDTFLRYEFIKNEDSIPFVTYDFTSFNSQKDVVDKFTDIVQSISLQNNDLAYIRIVIHDPLFKQTLSEISKKYSNILLTFKKNKSSVIKRSESSITSLKIITKDNLPSLINSFIDNQLSVDEITSILNSL